MARPRPEKPERKPELPVETRVRPMPLKLGDRLVDETGEYEVVGRPYTTAAGKNARFGVQRVDNPTSDMGSA